MNASLQKDYRCGVQVYRRIIGEQFMSTDPVSAESSSLQKNIDKEFKSAERLSMKSSSLQTDYR